MYKFYDRAMDLIALLLFPSKKHLDATLIVYVLALAIGLSLYFDNWLWFPAVILCMAMAWMIDRWML